MHVGLIRGGPIRPVALREASTRWMTGVDGGLLASLTPSAICRSVDLVGARTDEVVGEVHDRRSPSFGRVSRVEEEDTSAPGLTTWAGWDVRGGVSPGEGSMAFVTKEGWDDNEERYELMAVAARGFRPPRFLSRTEIYPDSSESESPFGAVLRQTWSMRYQRVRAVSGEVVPPYAIYLLGVNPPTDASPEDLVVFEDFYVDVHVREVAERRKALQAVPHKLVEVIKDPYKGAPTCLTAYELDEASASIRRHVGPPYSRGPEVWQRHSTPWRLWYRRLTVGD
jgi:hypothetical protein